MRCRFLFILAALLMIGSFSEYANSQAPQTPICSKDLVLQITNHHGFPPSFQNVATKGEFGQGVWYARFKMHPKWKQTADIVPPRAVNIVTSCSGDIANIRVSVFTGLKSHEREEFVGVYPVKENDRFLLTGLAKFGIEPFAILVIANERTNAILPAIDNQSASLKVSVESVAATLPTFKLKILNNSKKAVIAMALETRVNGQIGMSATPRGYRRGLLIKPSETYEYKFPGSLSNENLNPDKVPDARSSEILVIKSVIFEDGSFEGDENEAADIDAFYLGERIQIENILLVLERFLASDSQFQTLERLQSNIRTLPDEIDKDRVAEFIVKHNVQDEKRIYRLKIAAVVALRRQKNDLINTIGEFKSKNTEMPEVDALKKWLTAMQEGYKAWLDRLSK